MKWIWTLILTVFIALPVSGERVVSLSPVVTEIMAALSAGDQLVGVTSYCDYPVTVAQLPKVGDYRPSLEKIIALNPDLVLGLDAHAPLAKRLKRVGIRTRFYQSPRSLDGVATLIGAIAQELGKTSSGQQVIEALAAELGDADSRVNATAQPVAVVIVQASPMIVAGTQTYIADMVRAAGAQYVALPSTLAYPRLSLEQLIALSPKQLIVMTPSTRLALMRQPAIRSLVSDGVLSIKVISDPDYLARSGPRVTVGIAEMRGWFAE